MSVTVARAERAAAARFAVELPEGVRKLRDTWAAYRKADLGFRNHWYPICWAYELLGGRPLAQKLLGEPIIVRRVEGSVHALEDRCAHRRVPLSKRFECHTKDTVTCWYHGFTYDWRDGKLKTILTDPDNELIGKVGIKSYPVEEAKGLVFVFVGDQAPPPLGDDLPPGFLDDDRALNGRRIVVASNWRWATENGIDSTHIYIHRNSTLYASIPGVYPLGIVALPGHEAKLLFRTGPGPKGFYDALADNYTPLFSADIGDEKEVVKSNLKAEDEELEILIPTLGIWLPCATSVEGFPRRGMTSYEFYVPVDETSHLYYQISSRQPRQPGPQAESFRKLVDDYWGPRIFDDFNGDDVLAREGLQDAYTAGLGWTQEKLTTNDIPVIAWRQFASRYNRGIQKTDART